MKKSALIGCLSVGGLLLAACGGSSSGEGVYTYNTYLSTNPTTWSVHTWETSDEGYITGFTEIGLYDLIFNENRDGYEFQPEMASELPVMVDPTELTDEEWETFYASTVGNAASGMVWDIALNEAACWEDGTPITATDYVDSMERLLNPQYANYRADSYYSGDLVIANAEDYYKSGRQTIEAAYNYINKTTGSVTDGTGFWYINLGQTTPFFNAYFTGEDTDTEGNFYSVLNQRSNTYGDSVELAADRITYACAYYLHAFVYTDGSDAIASSDYGDDWQSLWDDGFRPSSVSSSMFEEDTTYIDLEDFDNLEVYTTKTSSSSWSEDNIERYTQSDLKADLLTFVRGIGVSNYSWAWELPLFTEITHEDSGLTQDDIGIRAIDDYTIRLYLTKVITSLNLRFDLCSNWLVNVDLYDSLSQDGGNNTLFTRYATSSVSNYSSYGPYKLTEYESGNRITISRNDNWYGYSDGLHDGQFQMDEIVTRIITDHNTALQEFLAGDLDDIDLSSSDMSTYGNSSRRTTTYESYTQKVSFNTDESKLESRQSDLSSGQNKTILANTDFREGLSLAINRVNFAAQTTGGSKAFTGLLNDLYIANQADGTAYRTTEQGESVYDMVYGNLGGEEIDSGEALSEDAYGYNYALSIEYIARALETELASDDSTSLQDGDQINIEFRVYNSESETTLSMYYFLNSAWSTVIEEAAAKVGADITLNMYMVTDEDYYTSATNGNYDMIFSTWGGATINPYGLMQVYCDSTFTNCCEYGFAGHQDEVYLEIDSDGDGVMESKTFDAWYNYMIDDLNEAQFGDDTTEMDEDTYAQWESVHNQKLNVLAGLEAGILNRFEAIPIVARGTSSLLSYKCEYGSDTYINLMGYGGVRYLEFNMDDAEWEEFCDTYNLSELYLS